MPTKSAATSQLDGGKKAEKGRNLRGRLRTLNETILNDGEDLADHTKNLLSERVRELDSLSRQVVRPSEQADDSEAFYILAQKGAEMAKRVVAGKGRSANDFIRHLKALFVEDTQQAADVDPLAFNWSRLSRRVNKYFHYAPGVSCLLGPLEALPKQKKQIQRQQRKPVGKAVAPEVLRAEDAEAAEKRETERNMETMWNVLKKSSEGVGFLELTMNHKSFAQFAENLFTLSFLVHNKRARIAKSEDSNAKGMLVFPHNEKLAQQDSKQTAQEKHRMQFVFAYTTANWVDYKNYLREEDCLMPHRSEPAEEEEAGPSQPAGKGGCDEAGHASYGEVASDEEEESPRPSKQKVRRHSRTKCSSKRALESPEEDDGRRDSSDDRQGHRAKKARAT